MSWGSDRTIKQVVRTLRGHLVQLFVGKGTKTSLCVQLPLESLLVGTPSRSWGCCFSGWSFLLKFSFLNQGKTSPHVTCTSCPLSTPCYWLPVMGECFCPLSSCPSILWWVFLGLFFFFVSLLLDAFWFINTNIRL